MLSESDINAVGDSGKVKVVEVVPFQGFPIPNITDTDTDVGILRLPPGPAQGVCVNTESVFMLTFTFQIRPNPSCRISPRASRYVGAKLCRARQAMCGSVCLAGYDRL
ncbi:hypothetical protein pipiens_019213 [Culex pipiens pipiens]|uniref:Uncharacterized protein n=1 Tax=Culex pipiens pipiens TaxID=38569 RepID=A0ABD1DVK9_CULPP